MPGLSHLPNPTKKFNQSSIRNWAQKVLNINKIWTHFIYHVSGTARSYVAEDYRNRLLDAIEGCERVISNSLHFLLSAAHLYAHPQEPVVNPRWVSPDSLVVTVRIGWGGFVHGCSRWGLRVWYSASHWTSLHQGIKIIPLNVRRTDLCPKMFRGGVCHARLGWGVVGHAGRGEWIGSCRDGHFTSKNFKVRRSWEKNQVGSKIHRFIHLPTFFVCDMLISFM